MSETQTNKNNLRDERSRVWHRYFQSAMVTICTAGVIWVVQTLAAVDKRQATIDVRIGNIEVQSAASYTLRDATRDFAAVYSRITSQDSRIEGIENHLHIRAASAPSPAPASKPSNGAIAHVLR